jgi:hypothetical protein
MLPLKRAPEYKHRVRAYAHDLAGRYGPDVADAFLRRVKAEEKLIRDNNRVGTELSFSVL